MTETITALDYANDRLNVAGGAHGWQFHDFRGGYVWALWLRVDEKVYAGQYAEFVGA